MPTPASRPRGLARLPAPAALRLAKDPDASVAALRRAAYSPSSRVWWALLTRPTPLPVSVQCVLARTMLEPRHLRWLATYPHLAPAGVDALVTAALARYPVSAPMCQRGVESALRAVMGTPALTLAQCAACVSGEGAWRMAGLWRVRERARCILVERFAPYHPVAHFRAVLEACCSSDDVALRDWALLTLTPAIGTAASVARP